MARKPGSWQSERCGVCSYAKVGEVNFALAKGVPVKAVAESHGLGASATYNHFRKHIPENYKKIIGAGVYADIDELLKPEPKPNSGRRDARPAFLPVPSAAAESPASPLSLRSTRRRVSPRPNDAHRSCQGGRR